MNAGKLASLFLWLLLTALAVGAGLGAGWFSTREVRFDESMLILAGLAAGGFAIVILPLGYLLDRSLSVLRLQIDQSARGTDETTSPIRQARWMAPLTRSVVGAVDRFQQREAGLRSQLRDLEIRHRVSEAERRLTDAVLNSLRDSVLVVDRFTEVVMVNEAAARSFHFELQDAHHRPISEIIDDGKLCQLISDAREAGNPFERRHLCHEIHVTDSQGNAEQRSFDITLACFENHKHEVGGVLAVLHDQTHEREVSQMKSDFVSKASHELRTPLSSIRAYVEMLVDGEAEDEGARQEFYRIIQTEANRLGRLIDNMLNISRIEAGIIQIERENVDLATLVDRAVSTLDPQAREKKITLGQKLAEVDLKVEGDTDMLYQVVLNLVSNAVKYTPEGGRVTIGADSDNLTRSVVVTISDTGLGIPPDALPKLFEKFYRVDNYKRVAKGTGLGLSLCKQIVETVHHGQIGVESKLGMGSKFWFSIPMRYAGSRAAA